MDVTIAALLGDIKKDHFLRLDVEVLLAFVLGVSRAYLHTWPQQVVSDEDSQRFKSLWARRLQGEPLAYLLGYRQFWSLTLKVTPNVLNLRKTLR